MQLEAYAASDVGPVRENNEDAWLVDVEASVFAVADGMGGHAAGEVASQIAVETVQGILLGELDPDETILQLAVDDSAEVLRERLRYCMNQASVRIRQEAERVPEYRRMGTTLVLMIVEEGLAHLAHVGDSRIYRYRGGALTLLTRDHTVVQQELDAGRLTPELARIVPHKNILTKSLGAPGLVEPDLACHPAEVGDIYLLFSDGITDPLDDPTIEGICGETHPEDLAQVLVDRAVQDGGEDNATAVVVCLQAD